MFSVRQPTIIRLISCQLVSAQQSFPRRRPLNTIVTMSTKPLNILVVFDDQLGRCQPMDSQQRLFDQLRTELVSLIGRDRCVVYRVTADEMRTKPWQQSTRLVIDLVDGDDQPAKDYVKGFGGVNIRLDVGQLFDETASKLRRDYFGKKIKAQGAVEEVSGRNSLNDLKPTEAYLIPNDEPGFDNLMQEVKSNAKFNAMMYQVKGLNEVNAGDQRIPLVINSNPTAFDWRKYFTVLTTTKLGRRIVFADIATTTMSLIEPFSAIDGMVAVANQQIFGRGRGENQWITARDSLAMTLHLKIDLNSHLGRHLGFAQHLAALAIVQAIKSLAKKAQPTLDVRVKWPNDVYWTKNMAKLAGILVNSTMIGQTVHCYFGVGLNVANSEPSTCINDVIDDYNQSVSKSDALAHTSCEEMMARILSRLEQLLAIFETEDGLYDIKSMYVDNWIHSNQVVSMVSGDKSGETKTARVMGLDNDGYLLVADRNQKIISVQPDGNRFDMLKNLLSR